MSPDMVKAQEIEQGEWFVKKNGHYAYMRISDSSARFLTLDSCQYVFGVCYTGNIARVRRGTLVHRATIKDHIANIAANANWEEMVGVKPEKHASACFMCPSCAQIVGYGSTPERPLPACPVCDQPMSHCIPPDEKRKPRKTTITIMEE